MPSVFKRFVQAGRVAYYNRGENIRQLTVVLQIIDQNRVLVQDVKTGTLRHQVNVKSIELTDFVLKVDKDSSKDDVNKALKDEDVVNKWQETADFKVFKKREVRAGLTDFERFKVRKLKSLRSKLLKEQLAK